MKESTGESRYRKRPPEKTVSYQCARCGKILPFCWQCRCGFQICMDCMKKDIGLLFLQQHHLDFAPSAISLSDSGQSPLSGRLAVLSPMPLKDWDDLGLLLQLGGRVDENGGICFLYLADLRVESWRRRPGCLCFHDLVPAVFPRGFFRRSEFSFNWALPGRQRL